MESDPPRRRVEPERSLAEVGSKRAHRATQQLFVDIEAHFRAALKGFKSLSFALSDEEGWVQRLRREPHAQARLCRSVREHRAAGHLFSAVRHYHPWSVEEHAHLVDLYERSDSYLRALGLATFKAECEFSPTTPEVCKVRGRHIWSHVRPYPRQRHAATQCSLTAETSLSSESEGTPTEDEPPAKRPK
jgi:hypothetical protein